MEDDSPDLLVDIDGGHSLSALVTGAAAGGLDLAPGRPVVASVAASAIHLIPLDGADVPEPARG